MFHDQESNSHMQHILFNLSLVCRITAPMETKAQRVQQSPPGNSWRSISLFGMSANTWRDFYKSGDMFRHCQLRDNRDQMSQNNTGEESVYASVHQHNQNLVMACI